MKYFRYHNTNCFFVESKTQNKLLAIDAGWPCTFYEYQRCMKQVGYEFKQISWAIVTHFHMDHAGLIGEFIKNNVTCFIFENQIECIDVMERIIMKNKEYRDYEKIDKTKLISIKVNDSLKMLNSIGITGEVLATKGHSLDSITYITDKAEAIIGDLSPIDQIMENDQESINNWELIKNKNIKKIFPSHAELFEIGKNG